MLVRRSTAGDRILTVAAELLESGADPNIVGYNNQRALDLCLENEFDSLAELLVRYGADSAKREFI